MFKQRISWMAGKPKSGGDAFASVDRLLTDPTLARKPAHAHGAAIGSSVSTPAVSHASLGAEAPPPAPSTDPFDTLPPPAPSTDPFDTLDVFAALVPSSAHGAAIGSSVSTPAVSHASLGAEAPAEAPAPSTDPFDTLPPPAPSTDPFDAFAAPVTPDLDYKIKCGIAILAYISTGKKEVSDSAGAMYAELSPALKGQLEQADVEAAVAVANAVRKDLGEGNWTAAQINAAFATRGVGIDVAAVGGLFVSTAAGDANPAIGVRAGSGDSHPSAPLLRTLSPTGGSGGADSTPPPLPHTTPRRLPSLDDGSSTPSSDHTVVSRLLESSERLAALFVILAADAADAAVGGGGGDAVMTASKKAVENAVGTEMTEADRQAAARQAANISGSIKP